ncbi:hypothetical protein DPMN_067733 [Dreissena polymorpha]|uniref:Uncharacterized protein n=1 Tax=Dreissena polymorpha TaxID=45954 RepID=A0A9D4BLK6_DREPO|nr:hypothetical protein DPMN_067733 [Dreissena polymorpha]
MLLCIAVDSCAVSPTGDKLYITNHPKHKLLILARDGSVLVTFSTGLANSCKRDTFRAGAGMWRPILQLLNHTVGQ